MIRFVIGLFLVMGGVGSIEQDTVTILEGMTICAVGLGLMIWAVPKINEEFA